MINRFISGALLTVFLVLSFANLVRAQDCDIGYELIYSLREPERPSFTVWESRIDEVDIQEGFKSAVLMGNGHVYVVGERYDEALDADRTVLVAEVKKNGRKAWERRHSISGLKNVVKVLRHGPGAYLVLGNRVLEDKRKVLWLGLFGRRGDLLWEKEVRDENSDLESWDIVSLRGGESFMVAASIKKEGLGTAQSAILYTLSKEAEVIGDRLIYTGFEGRLLGLDVLPNGDLLGSGYSYISDGRRAGWLLRMSEDGDIKWQHQFPRGSAGQLHMGKAYLSNTILVAGTVLPNTKEGHRSGWLMVVDAFSGNVGWQRYFTSLDMALSAQDLMISPDGLISVMLDADRPPRPAFSRQPQEDALSQEYIRLVTLTPRGAIHINDAFLSGETADAYQLLEGPNSERIMVGQAKFSQSIEMPGTDRGDGTPEVEIEKSKGGWLAAAVTMDLYDDPCKQPRRFLP